MICTKGVKEREEAFRVNISVMNVELSVLLGCWVFVEALECVKKEIAHYTYAISMQAMSL